MEDCLPHHLPEGRPYSIAVLKYHCSIPVPVIRLNHDIRAAHRPKRANLACSNARQQEETVKRTLFIAVVLAAATSGLVAQAVNEPGPHPSKLTTVEQTPKAIVFQLRIEHAEKQIKRQAAIAKMLYLAHGCRDTFAELTARNAYAYGLPVRLVTGVVIVESTCRPKVVSSEGAVGLMQVSRIWHVSRLQLEDPAFNLRKGSEILASYTRQYGLREGLHHYNGMGVGCAACDAGYADKVLLVAGLIK